MIDARHRRILMGLLLSVARLGMAQDTTVPQTHFRFSGAPHSVWRATPPSPARLATPAPAWLELRSVHGTRKAWSNHRLVLAVRPGATLPEPNLTRWKLRVDRQPAPNLWILEARDAWTAARAAHDLGQHPQVILASPVLRRTAALQAVFAPRPQDPYFPRQWHLENRDSQGIPLGPDINPRAAWASTRGAGINIGIADIGFETTHPDLAAAAAGMPHFDFVKNLANPAVYGAHGTCVAGLAGAVGSNSIGVTGVAPEARLTSLVIWDSGGFIVDEESLMDMYQYRNEDIQIQNHSWGNGDIYQLGMSALESLGVSNAVTRGRGGRGVILVRAASNYRIDGGNANDDASGNDPRSIAVAAVRRDGRAASYSNPGACVLVSGLSADLKDPFQTTDTLATTDRVGSSGYNVFGTEDLADYAFGTTGFDGTSGATPQISGIAALVLATNPELTYRDVQQILIHAARYYDDTDPMAYRNAAGYRVGDNQGFGVPDAGEAVRLARHWTHRPPLFAASILANVSLAVPDDGLRVFVTGTNGIERSIRCAPSLGLHPDDSSLRLPLVFVGTATQDITTNLSARAPLIERGPVGNPAQAYFKDKIARVARAGAPFAILYNHLNRDEIFQPDGTDYVPIPAVLISENEGRALVARLDAGEPLTAQIRLDRVQHTFTVTNTLSCEHVGLRVRAIHNSRGDLRITLVSPSGTRSVLQRLNEDTEPGPENWTYWSVQHFYEPSVGTWTASFADERSGTSGTIVELELLLRGVPIEDTDADGLDDRWERDRFGSLEARPADDPDGDGYANAREQVLGTDPMRNDRPTTLEIGTFDTQRLLRLSWPALDNTTYRVWGSSDPAVHEAAEVARVRGRFPEADWVLPNDAAPHQFYRLEVLPPEP